MLRCSIHNNENCGSDTERLPDLDELLASSSDSDISGNKEELGRQDNADNFG